MMKQLFEEVRKLQEKELTRAAEQHGSTFNSLHEAYAVMLEEIQEAAQEMRETENAAGGLWSFIRHDNEPGAFAAINAIEERALLLACEAIQVAAMASKARTLKKEGTP